MGWYTVQYKMLLFCVKTVVKESVTQNFDTSLPEEEEERKKKNTLAV